MTMKMKNLVGLDTELVVPKVDSKKVIDKLKNPKKVVTQTAAQLINKKSVDIKTKMKAIREEVYKILGHYTEDTVCIRDAISFHAYIDAAIKNGIIAIDTETDNSLEPITCKLMGPCIYTPGQKHAYIPVSHYDMDTGKLLDNQLTPRQIKYEFDRLKDVKVLMHNATFDFKVIHCTCDCDLECYWDTRVGAKMLDENESASLKDQYILHINHDQEKYSIENLFEGLEYAIFEPELFALYAATDAYMTYELYLYQKEKFEDPDLKDVYNVFRTIEMPMIKVIADMELTGIGVDVDYAKRLSEYYHTKAADYSKEVDRQLEILKPQIDAWRVSPEANTITKNQPSSDWVYFDASGGPGDIPYWYNTKEHRQADPRKGEHWPAPNAKSKTPCQKLADPVELTSSTQLAILLYDILKVPVLDESRPRSTDKKVLQELADTGNYPICSAILEQRDFDKLLNTFIDKMPSLVIPKTGRLHARFDALGTGTGRLSSNSPNLQNIPSHNTLVRMIFAPKKGYSIVGSDYSAQEPRTLASMAKDKLMIDTFENNRDLYATVGSTLFKVPYESCLEFHPVTHAKQVDGKARRSRAKVFQLGISYCMSAQGLAKRLNTSRKEAEDFIAEYYKGFSGVNQFNKDSQAMARKYGYVTTVNGRRRHLPNAQLPEFTIVPKGGLDRFNPLIGAKPHADQKMQKIADQLLERLKAAKFSKDRNQIISEAEKLGFVVTDNRSTINRSLRQCVNARSQGSAADMTKKAMISIHDDPEMIRLGFKLIAPIHDEVFGEVPTENAEAAAKRLGELMIAAAATQCTVSAKVDPYVVSDGWYEDENSAKVLDAYTKATKEGKDDAEAVEAACEAFPVFDPKSIELVCHNQYQIGTDSLKYGPGYFKE